MATLPKSFNTVSGATPYKDLFQKVTIVPANCSLAFISTQWACDAETGELPAGMEGDYAKQSAKIWEQVIGILKELGVTLKEVVHVTVNFGEFTDEIGKICVEAEMAVTPPEWHADMFKYSLNYNGMSHFHRSGIVHTVELIVAVPPLK